MSSTQGMESCDTGLKNDKVNKPDKRTKRHLSPIEENILLASLKELIANGWKSDYGFRGGYLNKLEELMRKEIPGTDLKGIPNINSKLQTWKKNYNSLNSMLSLRGIGFKDHMIDCTNEQWDQIVKSDANAKAMRRKAWPMYDDWKEIFGKDRATGKHAEDVLDAGKDRATGEHAEDVLDAVNELLSQDNQANEDMAVDYYVSLDHIDDNIAGENSVCGSGNGAAKNGMCGGDKGEAVNKSLGKKRKHKDTQESITDVLCEISHNTNARLEKIASRIGYEFDIDEAKKDAFALLDNISGLSLDEKFDVCEIFADKIERLLIFKGLPESARPQYVQRLLKSKPA